MQKGGQDLSQGMNDAMGHMLGTGTELRGGVQSGAHPCFLAASMGQEHWLLKTLHTASHTLSSVNMLSLLSKQQRVPKMKLVYFKDAFSRFLPYTLL